MVRPKAKPIRRKIYGMKWDGIVRRDFFKKSKLWDMLHWKSNSICRRKCIWILLEQNNGHFLPFMCLPPRLKILKLSYQSLWYGLVIRITRVIETWNMPHPSSTTWNSHCSVCLPQNQSLFVKDVREVLSNITDGVTQGYFLLIEYSRLVTLCLRTWFPTVIQKKAGTRFMFKLYIRNACFVYKHKCRPLLLVI